MCSASLSACANHGRGKQDRDVTRVGGISKSTHHVVSTRPDSRMPLDGECHCDTLRSVLRGLTGAQKEKGWLRKRISPGERMVSTNEYFVHTGPPIKRQLFISRKIGGLCVSSVLLRLRVFSDPLKIVWSSPREGSAAVPNLRQLDP
jgi:hypothetical protein